MSTPKGRSILSDLSQCASRGWYVKDFTKLVQKILDVVQHRNEILSGGVASVGATVSASVLQANVTAMSVVMNGRLKAATAALTNTDLFATAGSIGQAIYTNGATAAAISLTAGQVAQVALIACNTDGAGGADDLDNGAVKFVAVVAGTATTFMTKTAPPTSVEVQAALAASTGVHAGVTGWVHVATIEWDEGSGSPVATFALNRNNVALAI